VIVLFGSEPVQQEARTFEQRFPPNPRLTGVVFLEDPTVPVGEDDWPTETDRVCERELLSARDASLAVSAISAWEIALKASKQRLRLPMDAPYWWSEVLAAYQIPAIAMNSVAESLPHNDPADRMVVATARALGAQWVTADEVLRKHVPFAVW
jgi:PIN domain nuclease of toxin-antitoxin system